MSVLMLQLPRLLMRQHLLTLVVIVQHMHGISVSSSRLEL